MSPLVSKHQSGMGEGILHSGVLGDRIVEVTLELPPSRRIDRFCFPGHVGRKWAATATITRPGIRREKQDLFGVPSIRDTST